LKLSVFGLGYVGTVSAACLAARGHQVTGVDINPAKVATINAGRAPIVEAGIDELVAHAVRRQALRATTDAGEAVRDSEISLVCVGTPSARNGSLDISALVRVTQEIGAAIASNGTSHTVVVRCTMLPGTFRHHVLPALERAGATYGIDFSAAINPEYLREGTAVADFDNPEKTVIGADDAATAARVASLYEGLPGALLAVTPEVAEFSKYVDNIWHALKIGFANEIGNLCKAHTIDSDALMEVFLADRKLNISPAYLKPGFAFGGSCLPKDTRAVAYLARVCDLELPILQSILPGNQRQIERAVEWILGFEKRRIALLGCAFKAGTDDLRESPYVILAERLLGKGCDLRIFDPNVRLSMLTGANRAYVMAKLPHIANLLVSSADEAIRDSELVILSAGAPEYVEAARRVSSRQILLDFAHVPELGSLPNRQCLNA
jgi:GDP-mannose 6-dehydrogenase